MFCHMLWILLLVLYTISIFTLVFFSKYITAITINIKLLFSTVTISICFTLVLEPYQTIYNQSYVNIINSIL